MKKRLQGMRWRLAAANGLLGGILCLMLSSLQAVAGTDGLVHLGEGSRLLIPMGTYVSVHGTILTADDPNRLIIRASDQGAGSLLHTAHAQATIQRRFCGPPHAWYEIASPVAQQEVEPDFSGPGASLLAYYEPAQRWVNAVNHAVWPTWADANNGQDILQPFKGYQAGFAHNMPDHALRLFTGPLNHGSHSQVLKRFAHPSDPYVGWNLLGNPYVTAIDWFMEEAWSGRDCLEGGGAGKGSSMWIWNEEAGNYGVVHTHAFGRGHNKNHGLIAPLQAFWVRVAPGSHGCVFSVHEQARRHAALPAEKTMQASDARVLRLALTAGDGKSWADELIVELGHAPGMTGAEKMFSPREEVPQLYAMRNGQAYSILFLDTASKAQPLDVHILRGSTLPHVLTLEHAPGFPAQVRMEDPATGKTHFLGKGEPYLLPEPWEKNQPLLLRLHLYP